MGIFHTSILMVESEENAITGYCIVLSSYYHIILIFDQNNKNILNLAGGFHF